MFAAGDASKDAAVFIGGANLFAGKNKQGMIYPIAVGNVLCRLISKCFLFVLSEKAASTFAPLQLGIGIRGGAEALVNTVRSIVNDNLISPSNMWVLEIDLVNACNSYVGTYAFAEVRRLFPEVVGWVEYVFGCQTELVFDGPHCQELHGWTPGKPSCGPYIHLCSPSQY